MKYLVFFMIILGTTSYAEAQSKEEKKLNAAIERLRQAMVDPDAATFDELMADDLSYGHSGGLVEDKKTCIASMIDGKFNFETIQLSEQSLQITGKTGVVRHRFIARTHDAGKEPTYIKLKVLTVWVKQQGRWVLLARQSVRL